MKDIEQLDFLGGAMAFGEFPTPPIDRKYKTMQQQYGTIEGKTCKTCKHHVCYKYHYKNYHKCELWYVSHSAATDIRLKNQACGKYEEANNE